MRRKPCGCTKELYLCTCIRSTPCFYWLSGGRQKRKERKRKERKKGEEKTYNCKTLCEGDQSVTVVVTFVIRVYTLARHDCKRINSCLCLCLCYCKSCQGAQYFHHVARSYFFESVCFDKSLSVGSNLVGGTHNLIGLFFKKENHVRWIHFQTVDERL